MKTEFDKQILRYTYLNSWTSVYQGLSFTLYPASHNKCLDPQLEIKPSMQFFKFES